MSFMKNLLKTAVNIGVSEAGGQLDSILNSAVGTLKDTLKNSQMASTLSRPVNTGDSEIMNDFESITNTMYRLKEEDDAEEVMTLSKAKALAKKEENFADNRYFLTDLKHREESYLGHHREYYVFYIFVDKSLSIDGCSSVEVEKEDVVAVRDFGMCDDIQVGYLLTVKPDAIVKILRKVSKEESASGSKMDSMPIEDIMRKRTTSYAGDAAQELYYKI